MNKNYREEVFALLDDERNKQIEAGKEDRHAFASWMIIITDYLGRVANYMWKMVSNPNEHTIEGFRDSLIKVVAVGVAWLENTVELVDILTPPPSEETIEAEFEMATLEIEDKEGNKTEIEVTIAEDLDVEVVTKEE